MRRVAIALLLVVIAFSAMAKNELLVDTRQLQMNDLLTITVSLEGSFASIEEAHIPLRNLRLLGEPSVSSEFAFINGEVSRRKVFRYRARPVAPGPAQVGPITLTGDDGQHDVLTAIALQVLEDRASGSNDAAVVMRELMATNRPPMFVVAEIEKTSAFVGEPIVVTWFLYNAAAIQEWQVVAVPKLADFWVEELQRGENAERVYVGDAMVQRMPIRRAVLFPLRSGRMHVDGMTVEASIMQRTRGGPFAMFEGTIVDATFTSASFDLDIKPLPAGPTIDAVGNLALRCDPPTQRNAGPVVLRVALEGVGNLRAVAAPRFEGDVAGTVQVDGGQVNVSRDETNIAMTRRWQFLIFPSSPGPLQIPAMSMRTFVPPTGERRELRCNATIIDVVAAKPPSSKNPNAPEPPPLETRATWPWVLGIGALLIATAFAVIKLQRELALRRAVRDVLRDNATPEEIRARMESRVHIRRDEASDRGDAWRALLSLLDAKERERDIAVNADAEIARRVREVLRLSA